MLSVILALSLLSADPVVKKPKVATPTGTRIDIYPLHMKHPPKSWGCTHLAGTEYSCRTVKATHLDGAKQ